MSDKPVQFEMREGNVVLRQGHDLLILPPDQAKTLAQAILVKLKGRKLK